MTPQEAQQAETIAVMKRRHKYQDSVLETKLSYESGIFRDCHSDREMVLEIVDSQAQKIQAQDARITALRTLYSEANQESQERYLLTIEQAQKITEQAAEIEKLKANYSAMVQTNRQRG